MAGITDYGFVRKTLQEILTSMKQRVKDKLGNDWNVSTGSIEDQFLSVFAEEADQAWQGLEGVYSSQTLDGAEGIYLDDILSRQGVYRQGKTASSGKGLLLSNYATVTLGQIIGTFHTTIATNNLVYNVQEEITIDNYMSAYTLSAAQLSLGVEYTFNIYNISSPVASEFVWTPTSESDKDSMLENFAVYINNSILSKPAPAYFDESTRTMYFGFNESTNLPAPFSVNQLYVSSTPRVGTLGHTVFLKTDTLGFNPLSPDGLTSLSPTYLGYTDIINGDDFNAGSDIQTDAEYRLAAINIKDSSVAGTTDSIISSLLRVEGVVDAEVYENPTPDYIYDISSNLVANPYTYNVAVLGGDDNEVAQVILDKSPANTARYGLYNALAINSKGMSVPVNFTRVGYFDVAVDIKYKAKDNTLLTDSEKTKVINNIQLGMNSLKIGDIVPKNLLEAITFQSVAFGRLSQVTVELKDLTLGGSIFSNTDLTADYDEKPRVLSDKITFQRI